MSQNAKKISVSIAGAELSRSCHACAFFHSQEEYYQVLLPFMKEGFKVGDKTLHIVESSNHETHKNRLQKSDINVENVLASGQFELKSWNESYIAGGAFDQDKMLDLVGEVLEDAKVQGYALSRLVGNMEWACLKDVPGVSNIVKYESRLNTLIQNYDTILVCCYDLTKHSASVVMDVLRTHPYVIVGGTMHENPYFVSPEKFLAEVEAREQAQALAMISRSAENESHSASNSEKASNIVQ